MVLAAGKRSSPESLDALAQLCARYWFPLYAYARRRAHDVHEAEDLTQAFFATLLEKDCLAAVKPERGRFRAFLLTAFKHFLANQWDKSRAQKRGGGVTSIPLDFVSAGRRYALEPADHLTPERAYERQWALNLLDEVLDRLRAEYVGAGKIDQFERLKPLLTPGTARPSHADLARDLGMTAGAVGVAAHRLRRRYVELLRAEIGQTVADAREVDDEIRSLFTALEP
jgi:RNA polymerase sigma-70 factor (ECF subfamily)